MLRRTAASHCWLAFASLIPGHWQAACFLASTARRMRIFFEVCWHARLLPVTARHLSILEVSYCQVASLACASNESVTFSGKLEQLYAYFSTAGEDTRFFGAVATAAVAKKKFSTLDGLPVIPEGSRVVHPTRGAGVVARIDEHDPRDKPFRVEYDNNEVHDYSMGSSKELVMREEARSPPMSRDDRSPVHATIRIDGSSENGQLGSEDGGRYAVVSKHTCRAALSQLFQMGVATSSPLMIIRPCTRICARHRCSVFESYRTNTDYGSNFNSSDSPQRLALKLTGLNRTRDATTLRYPELTTHGGLACRLDMPTVSPQAAQPVDAVDSRRDFLADAYSDVHTHPLPPPPAPADLQIGLRPMLRIPVPHAGADEHALRTGVPPPSQTTPAEIHRPLPYGPSHIRRAAGKPGPVPPRSASSPLATFVSAEPSRESSRHRKFSPAPNSMPWPTSTQPDGTTRR